MTRNHRKQGRTDISRAAVNPLRCAVRVARKPSASIPGRPFDECVSPLEAAGKAFCALALRSVTA
jgi:hypothetical protein